MAKKNGGNEIPSFDGAEFSGEKAKSRETLNRMMKMLKIPEQRWGSIATDILKQDGEQVYLTPSTKELLPLKEVVDESEDADNSIDESDTSDALLADDVDESDGKLSLTIVEYPRMDAEEKKVINRFSRLFHETKRNGRDNREELCILLDELKDCGTFNGEDAQKVYDAIEDIYNKSLHFYS